jgi:leucyl aminopeptidase
MFTPALSQSPVPDSIPIHLVAEEECETWLKSQSSAIQQWLAAHHFKGERHRLVLLPGSTGGVAQIAYGLGRRAAGDKITLWHAAGLPERLPDGRYHIVNELSAASASQFALGWAYGLYRFDRYRKEQRAPRAVSLAAPANADITHAERLNAACTLARDLINTPASDLNPETLAREITRVATRYSARCVEYVGDELLRQKLSAVHAVGRASDVAPRLVDFQWGSAHHPKVTLVGKGVCFDSGGLDIKPASGMLMMKKDMGGAACVLGLAQAVMDAKLPIRLRVIIPAVENAISGNAFRPGDVLATRKGLSVEVGNTDAEGRLILCDALALADEEKPDLLIDCATLTGAARTALGPELPALFCNDDALSAEFVRIAHREADPVWPLPLWSNYDDELSSKIADLNNVSPSGFSGAIIGALYLRRFVTNTRHWIHLDLYGWNSKDRPGRPVGAEAQTLRALYALLKERYAS